MFDTLGKPSTAKLPDLRGSGDAHRTMSEDEKALQHRDLYNLGHSGQIHKRQRMDVDTSGARMPERVSVSPPLPLDGHYRRAAQPLVGSEATRSHPLTTSSSSSASSSRLPSPRYDPSMQLQKPHLRSPPLAPFAYGQHTEQHSQPPPPPTRSPDHYQQHQQQPHQKIPLKRQAPDANATAYDQTVSREPGFPPHQSHFGQQSSQGAHSKVHPGQSHHQTYQPQHAPQPYPRQIQRQDRSNLPAPFPSDTDIHNSFVDGFSGQPDDGHGLALLRGYPLPRPLGMRRSKAPPVVRQCENCNTSDSPEWRRGPSGHKTLCNACGLRYARIIAKRRDAHRKNTGGNEQVLLPAPPVSQVMSFEASQRHLGLTVNGMANGTERLDTAMDPSPTGQFHQADQHPQHSHIDAQPRQPQQPPHQQYYPPQSSTSGYQ
ncbi:hypothetical protein BC831DRAFT_456786 [Entophlyctis helioformis]|nr:hypothetical protein BC831DRAFT_456786 [Entophlyctis helioformis]